MTMGRKQEREIDDFRDQEDILIDYIEIAYHLGQVPHSRWRDGSFKSLMADAKNMVKVMRRE